MSRLASLTASLEATCRAHRVPEDGASDIGKNLAQAIYYGLTCTLDEYVEVTVLARRSARAASDFVLVLSNAETEELEEDLVEAANQFRDPCGCWPREWPSGEGCVDCSERAA